MANWLPNAVSFQLVWIAAVAGAAQGWWWAGPAALAMFAAWQLPLSASPRADLRLMLIAALVGLVIDTIWVQAGLMRFETPEPWTATAPIWIVALWMGYALTLNHSLAALKRHLSWAALLGLIGGPLAYAIAENAWHAVQLQPPRWIALAALALAWGAVTPALSMAATHFDKTSPRAVGQP